MDPGPGDAGGMGGWAAGALLGAVLLSALLWGLPVRSGSPETPEARDPAAHAAPTSDTLSPSPAEGTTHDAATVDASATEDATEAATPTDAPADLSSELDGILDRFPWRSSRWGVLALSLDRGDTLFARAAHEPLAPASNVKILTSAAALHYLGPEFRFQTFVLTRGQIDEEGTLRGDVILYGTGDPAISDRLFPSKTAVIDSLAAELEARGVRRIEGDVVGDGSFFPDEMLPPGWDRTDLNDWFAAPVSALSFNENVATLRIEPGPRAGTPPVVHTIPEEAPLQFLNDAATVPSRAWPPLMVDRPDPREPIRVLGEMRVGGRDAWRVITVDDPALFAADALRRALARREIPLTGASRSLSANEESLVSKRTLWAPGLRDEPEVRILARHRSPPLRELLQVLNRQSHNLYAELVLKTLGQVALNDGSRAGGVRAVSRYMSAEAGVDPSAFHLEDGSGLSPQNRASAGAFVAVLAHAARQPWAGHLWRALPEAGNWRQLRRMYRTPAARNLRAKTGTIEGVSALSGIVRTREGERILFSILANDVPSTSAAKNVEDRIGAALAAFDRPFRPSMALADAPPDTPPDSSFAGRHRVEPGESFSSIARRYGVPVEALINANPGVMPRRLRAGQVLEVPGG